MGPAEKQKSHLSYHPSDSVISRAGFVSFVSGDIAIWRLYAIKPLIERV